MWKADDFSIINYQVYLTNLSILVPPSAHLRSDLVVIGANKAGRRRITIINYRDGNVADHRQSRFPLRITYLSPDILPTSKSIFAARNISTTMNCLLRMD